MRSERKKLSNGMEIPLMGLGTYRMKNKEEVIYESIKNGVRLIEVFNDLTGGYEEGIGIRKALEHGIVKREDLIIIGKIFMHKKNPKEILRRTLHALGINYIDIYLDCFPYSKDYRDQSNIIYSFEPISIYDFWPKMEELVDIGLVKALGVCNYNIQGLCNLLSFCRIKPVVNQVEFHPFCYQKNLKEFCDKENIAVFAASPLCNSVSLRYFSYFKNKGDNFNKFNIFEKQIVKDYARKYCKTEGQIILNWLYTIGVIPIVGTSKTLRMKENLHALEFKMEDKDFENMSTHFLNWKNKKFRNGRKEFGINIFG